MATGPSLTGEHFDKRLILCPDCKAVLPERAAAHRRSAEAESIQAGAMIVVNAGPLDKDSAAFHSTDSVPGVERDTTVRRHH